jgi:hypothetical protein
MLRLLDKSQNSQNTYFRKNYKYESYHVAVLCTECLCHNADKPVWMHIEVMFVWAMTQCNLLDGYWSPGLPHSAVC